MNSVMLCWLKISGQTVRRCLPHWTGVCTAAQQAGENNWFLTEVFIFIPTFGRKIEERKQIKWSEFCLSMTNFFLGFCFLWI